MALSGLVMGMVLTSLTPEAIANDDKVFPAQFCVPLDDNDSIDQEHTKFDVDGQGLMNDSGKEQEYLCPIARDSVKEDLEQVWVRIKNEKGKKDTECCVHSFSPDGSSDDSKCESADEGDEVQSIELDLGSLKAWDNGYYVLTCTLEDEEEIRSYRTSEKRD